MCRCGTCRARSRPGAPLARQSPDMQASGTKEGVRLDKWLWAARFFKTRGLAVEEIGKGRVLINGHPAKASREVREGDVVDLRQATFARTVVVRALGRLRGPASVA